MVAKDFAGRWRIVEMEVWDEDLLDLVETDIRRRDGRRNHLRRT